MEAEADARRNAALVRPMEAGYAVTAGIFEPAPAEDRATGLGLSLNLVNVFLYMTNYNLIIPTIGPFCERLRVPASTGGLVIGCADFMAILVAVGYSVWSNRTFKRPLLFASVVCGVGNLLVTLSYDAGSLPLLLAGRLLTGAGNGRILNRRYIADFVSLEGRTIASIGFVAASAAGMAVGPFIAVPLTALLRGYHDTLRFAGLTINVITVEGWLMVAAWAAFFVIAVLYFDEPLAAEAAEEPAAAEAEAAAPAANGADDGITEPLLPPPAATAAAVGEHAVAAEAGDEMGDDAGSSDGGASPPHDAVAAELGPDPFATAALPPASSLPPASADAAAESAMKMLGEDGTAAEQPLLAHFAEVLAEPSLLPTVACTVMLFLLKLLQQGSVSAVPVFTEDFYGWRAGAVGLFMTATSLAMIPVNFSVAGLATLVRPPPAMQHTQPHPVVDALPTDGRPTCYRPRLASGRTLCRLRRRRQTAAQHAGERPDVDGRVARLLRRGMSRDGVARRRRGGVARAVRHLRRARALLHQRPGGRVHERALQGHPPRARPRHLQRRCAPRGSQHSPHGARPPLDLARAGLLHVCGHVRDG